MTSLKPIPLSVFTISGRLPTKDKPISPLATHLQSTASSLDNDSEVETTPETSFWEDLANSVSESISDDNNDVSPTHQKLKFQLVTLFRVGIPSIFCGLAAFFAFPALALALAGFMNDAGVFAVLSQDSSQFVQNFLTVTGLLFSILVGQTYYFMYQQQESIYYALFNEVTEAKSLLEQVALVCQGRSMYSQVLISISRYVQNDLKKLQSDPAVLLSARPVDDPLESIMYMTSVGVPSSVYETVRSLRQARAARLGALQRKLPAIHMLLLWALAAIEGFSFPLLGAGTQTIGGYNILTVEGCLFGVMTFGIVMTLRVIDELWRPAGGAYNVDTVLSVMVKGLEEELRMRMKGKFYSAEKKYPTPQYVPREQEQIIEVNGRGRNDVKKLKKVEVEANKRDHNDVKKLKKEEVEVLQQGGFDARMLLHTAKAFKRASSRRKNRKNNKSKN